MHSLSVGEILALQPLHPCHVVGVWVPYAVGADPLHKAPACSPVKWAVAQRVVGGVVDGAVALAFPLLVDLDGEAGVLAIAEGLAHPAALSS